MANPVYTLDAREKGNLPISIASAMAIEALLGESTAENASKSNTPPILKYDTIWINLRTLYRNLHGSMDRKIFEKIHIDKQANELYTECLVIQAAIQEATHGKTKVLFYACTHRSLMSFYSKALIKEDKTPLQKEYSSMEKRVIERLASMHETTKDYEFLKLDVALRSPYPQQKVAIMTHIVVDLLELKNVSDIDLLESHTGAIKGKKLWYTKLKGDAEMQRIPFDRATLQFFGDKFGMFIPVQKDFREIVLEMAKKENWTQATTRSRMLLCLELSRQPQVYIAFYSLY